MNRSFLFKGYFLLDDLSFRQSSQLTAHFFLLSKWFRMLGRKKRGLTYGKEEDGPDKEIQAHL